MNSRAVICFLVFLFYCDVECRRSGGGGFKSSYSRPSYSRPSYSPSPSYSRSSYSHPSPSYSHPSPSSLSYPSWHPAPASRPAPAPAHAATSHPSPSYKPLGFESVKPVGSSSSGIGFKPEHASNVNSAPHPPPIGFKPSVNQGSSGFKASAPPAEHHGSNGGGSPPAYGFKPSAPVGPPVNSKPVGNVPPGAPYQVHPPPYTPHNPGVPPPAYNPAHNPAGYGPPPAYNPAGYGHAPAYNPAGYGQAPAYNGHYPQQQYHPSPGGYPTNNHYYGGTPGTTNININNINTNTHHSYGGGYGGGLGGGFGYHYPSYSYSYHDTGSTSLGFFLGYSLAKITTPTYHTHSSFYDGYTPRYDHYEVHHYYHNKDAVPAQSTIQANTIVGCIGDSGTICPVGTKSLCTSNGAILCVASATSTVPCANQTQGNCVTTTIPCVEGSKDCQMGENKTVTIPCISNAKVPGNITYVNNTIIVNNTTIINNNFTQNATIPLANLTTTTTEVPTTTTVGLNVTSTSEATRSKREAPAVPINDFCVTILALPAERKPTEQEKILKSGTGIFSKFLVRALGAA